MRDLRDEGSDVMVKSRIENQTAEGGASQRAESKVKFIFQQKREPTLQTGHEQGKV